jgi:membrane protein DedA with SNARE-associated domain
MDAILLIITKYSYAGIFISLCLGIIGFPIPDESLIAFSGFLLSQGKLNIILLLPVIITGAAFGITVSYLFGKLSGRYLSQKYAGKITINADHLQKIKEFYDKYGRFALLIGYFIPGVRHLTALFAGMNDMPYRQFAVFAYIGALLWTTTFLTLGYWLGHEWHYVTHNLLATAIIIVSLVLLLIAYLLEKR